MTHAHRTTLLLSVLMGTLSSCSAQSPGTEESTFPELPSSKQSVAAPAKLPAPANARAPANAQESRSTTQPQSAIEQAFPGQHGESKTGVFNTAFGPLELAYEEINGVAVIGGDVVMPLPEPHYRAAINADTRTWWPNGMISVDPIGVSDAGLASRIEEAIVFWEQNTPIRFIRGASSVNRIRFMLDSTNDDAASTTYVGNGGYGGVWLGKNVDTGRIRHEIGHVVGLFHEHQRSDRDNYVTFNSACLTSSANQYTKLTTEAVNIGAYDVQSLMHYGSWDLSSGCPALTLKDGSTFARQRDHLTDTDYNGVRELYEAWFLRRQAVDYDADGRDDIATWTPSTGRWSIRGSGGTVVDLVYGQAGDIPVPGYYDTWPGADLAYFHPATGQWHIRDYFGRDNLAQLGQLGDVPVPADYNNDGYTDLAVWTPTTGRWTIGGMGTSAPWGMPKDIPVPANYDGDGAADLALYRPSTGQWFVSTNMFGSGWVVQWGQPGDIPVPADFDGDGRADIAVWRPSTGQWWVINSSTGAGWVAEWGVASLRDVPVPARYNGSAVDMGIWRGSTGEWWIREWSVGQNYRVQVLGTMGDVPVP